MKVLLAMVTVPSVEDGAALQRAGIVGEGGIFDDQLGVSVVEDGTTGDVVILGRIEVGLHGVAGEGGSVDRQRGLSARRMSTIVDGATAVVRSIVGGGRRP